MAVQAPAAAEPAVMALVAEAPEAPIVARRILSDSDKGRASSISSFFQRAFRAAPIKVEDLITVKSEDVYTKWADDDLLALLSLSTPTLRAELLETLPEKFRGHPALKMTSKESKALEVDHIWEVQLFTRAVRDIELHKENSFSLTQLVYLSDSVVNDMANLTVTLQSINRIKGVVITAFLKQYGRSATGASFDSSFDNLLAMKPQPVLRASNFPPCLHCTSDDMREVNIVDNFRNAMRVFGSATATPPSSPLAFTLTSTFPPSFSQAHRPFSDEGQAR